LRKYLNNASLKGIVTLSSGTFLTQIIGLISIPILSRLFEPKDFGVFYSFVGVLQFSVLIASLKLEKAIVLPEKKKDRLYIFLLTNISGAILGLFITLLLIIAKLYLPIFLSGLEIKLLLILPFSILSFVCFSSLLIWFQSNEEYGKMAKLTIMQSLITMLTTILLGYIGYKSIGLIYGYIFGTIFTSLVVILIQFSNFRALTTNSTLSEFFQLLNRYKDFPKYYVPFSLFSRGLMLLAPIIFLEYYGQEITGFYSMGLRIVLVPSIILLSGVSNIFLMDARKEIKRSGYFYSSFKNTFKYLVLGSFIIYSFLYVFGEFFINLILGPSWNGMNSIFKLLIFIGAFEFIIQTFRNNLFVITEKQKLGAVIQGIYSIFFLLTIIIFGFLDIYVIIKIHVFLLIIYCIVILHFSLIYSKSKNQL
jgi:O-antigen/teichoic acid export membrane protein